MSSEIVKYFHVNFLILFLDKKEEENKWHEQQFLIGLFFVDGPVTVGMSLDIASIDTISEINMVRSYFGLLFQAAKSSNLSFFNILQHTFIMNY